ncbi:hypothetical protein HRR83_007704 [Exophiala dermatitidis]|uniref:Uncharacterized protein n=1 Tax=Exophiala dermatitidis TaxID=5970 RepID=A0AAN6ISC7_EXODE|nr:hypothetical protein HRR73_008927 [Exophiala dermatitidis]KAJ4507769.1 hypothetical protein HRR75_006479 [Exophiala dermatitidis]KAJ4509907.1 hypothetical protein HRR74_007059 [Exophiala dermatitidis]KAJ4539538.1 hypothetical protein HRR77_006420 [Exophiala dermatitidis]KAJ4542684.1 hypothetical protein HRR78_006773 [Exophiala dermatitidis]
MEDLLTLKPKHFRYVSVKNPDHTSHFDPVNHAPVRIATEDQVARGAGQTVHIYYDEQMGAYSACRLSSERLNKPGDFPQA